MLVAVIVALAGIAVQEGPFAVALTVQVALAPLARSLIAQVRVPPVPVLLQRVPLTVAPPSSAPATQSASGRLEVGEARMLPV
jgi:hypothetical protein